MAIPEPSNVPTDPGRSGARGAALAFTIGFGFTRLVIVLAFLVSLGISVADWMGALDTESKLVARIPVMTLLLVSIVAVYLLQERREEHDELRRAVAMRDEAISNTLQADLRTVNAEQSMELRKLLDTKGSELVGAVKGVIVETLPDQEAYYRRLGKEIRLAEKYVDDLTWGAISDATRSDDEEEAYQSYLRAIPELCRLRTSLKYREVYTFPSLGRVARAEALLAEKLTRYWVKFYDVHNHANLPPLMQFTIIDRKLVILGTHRGAQGSTDSEKYLAIQHPLIAEKFVTYFNIIWAGAKPIKDGSTTDMAALAKVRATLEGKKVKRKKASPGEPGDKIV